MQLVLGEHADPGEETNVTKPRRILDRNAHGRPTDRRSFDRFVARTTRKLRRQGRPNARTVATARAVLYVMGKAG